MLARWGVNKDRILIGCKCQTFSTLGNLCSSQKCPLRYPKVMSSFVEWSMYYYAIFLQTLEDFLSGSHMIFVPIITSHTYMEDKLAKDRFFEI